jgi:hypothetical protein
VEQAVAVEDQQQGGGRHPTKLTRDPPGPSLP